MAQRANKSGSNRRRLGNVGLFPARGGGSALVIPARAPIEQPNSSNSGRKSFTHLTNWLILLVRRSESAKGKDRVNRSRAKKLSPLIDEALRRGRLRT